MNSCSMFFSVSLLLDLLEAELPKTKLKKALVGIAIGVSLLYGEASFVTISQYSTRGLTFPCAPLTPPAVTI